jgi:hypothetical protein
MAMQNVYEVSYEALCKNDGEKRGVWSNEDDVHILANGSVDGAIKKARSFLLKRRTRWVDDDGKKRVERVMKVRITSCRRVMTLNA